MSLELCRSSPTRSSPPGNPSLIKRFSAGENFSNTFGCIFPPKSTANQSVHMTDTSQGSSNTRNHNPMMKETSYMKKPRKGTKKKAKPYLFQAPADTTAELDLRGLYTEISRTRTGAPSPLTPSSGRVPPSKILDFLYIGSVHDAQDADFISRENIRCVLNVCGEEYWSVDNNVIVYPFKIEDTCSADIAPLFRPTSDLIESMRRKYFEAKKKKHSILPRVLVHCQKGISRSSAIVIAYLIRRNGWSLSEAMQYVRRRRYGAEPNLGFLEALRQFENSMNSAARTSRYSQESLLVKNLPSTANADTVFNFFEKHIGCVKGVTVYSKPSSASHTPPSSGAKNVCETCSRDINGVSMKEDNATHFCAHTSPTLPTPKDTLCLVFFACFENLKLARDFATSHQMMMNELGAIQGRPIKLIVPVKAKMSRIGSSSYKTALPTVDRNNFKTNACEIDAKKRKGGMQNEVEHTNSRLLECVTQRTES